MEEKKIMREAIRLSLENVTSGNGVPFRAVIVKGGVININTSYLY
jgi:tRNA(Arg) A34 adenosine deaminase TadA